MGLLEPQVNESWEAKPRLTISGATISGAASGRQFYVDKGPFSHYRIQIYYSLNSATSVNGFVCSAESVGDIAQLTTSAVGAATISAAILPSAWAPDMYQSVPTSGRINLYPVIQQVAHTSGVAETSSFMFPATPLQGKYGRITLGISGTPHGSDVISAFVGLCYG